MQNLILSFYGVPLLGLLLSHKINFESSMLYLKNTFSLKEKYIFPKAQFVNAFTTFQSSKESTFII